MYIIRKFQITNKRSNKTTKITFQLGKKIESIMADLNVISWYRIIKHSFLLPWLVLIVSSFFMKNLTKHEIIYMNLFFYRFLWIILPFFRFVKILLRHILIHLIFPFLKIYWFHKGDPIKFPLFRFHKLILRWTRGKTLNNPNAGKKK